MDTNQINFLKLFGLSEDFTEHELKEAYRDLAHVWHPDKHTHNERLRIKAENQLKEINEGYEFLKQILKRRDSSTYTSYSKNDPQGSPNDDFETKKSTTYDKNEDKEEEEN